MKEILIVGAVLVDFVGTYKFKAADSSADDETATPLNKTGSVHISVGGAAFNIAANLAAKGINCSLFTYCQQNSPVGSLVKVAARNSGVGTKNLIDANLPSETAYVAIMRNEAVESGVTSSPIESIDIFSDGKLEKAIQSATTVVVETNLSAFQIAAILDLCAKYAKRCCAMAVSDAKADRLYQQGYRRKFDLVSLSRQEASHLDARLAEVGELSLPEVSAFCEKFNAKNLVISAGRHGFFVLTEAGGCTHVPAAPHVTVVNSLGAGDALFAAMCLAIDRNESPTDQSTVAKAREWTALVLGRAEANLGYRGFDLSPPPERWSVYVIVSAAICGLMLAASMTFGTRADYLFWPFFLGTCMSGGVLGALMRNYLWRPEGEQAKLNLRLVAIGVCIGLIAGCLNALPNFAAGDLPVARSSGAPRVNVVALVSFISSFVAGLAFDSVLSQLGRSDRRHPPE